MSALARFSKHWATFDSKHLVTLRVRRQPPTRPISSVTDDIENGLSNAKHFINEMKRLEMSETLCRWFELGLRTVKFCRKRLTRAHSASRHSGLCLKSWAYLMDSMACELSGQYRGLCIPGSISNNFGETHFYSEKFSSIFIIEPSLSVCCHLMQHHLMIFCKQQSKDTVVHW